MKKTDSQDTITKKDLEAIVHGLNIRFDKIEEHLEMIDLRIHNAERMNHLQIVSNTLAIKQELERKFKTELKLTVDNAVQKLESKMTQLNDRILTTVDPLLKELETREEDRTIATQQTKDIGDKLKSYEKRLTKLEKTALSV